MPSRQVVTVVLVVVVVMASVNVPLVAAGPVETLATPSPNVHLPERSRGDYTRSVGTRQQHRITKRSYIDSSCKGLYSRSVWNKLYHVCEDCQNIYRDSEVGKECRRGCFASDTFVMCLANLYKPLGEYITMATSLRGS